MDWGINWLRFLSNLKFLEGAANDFSGIFHKNGNYYKVDI